MKMHTDSESKGIGTALDQNFKTVIHDSDILSWILRGSMDVFRDKEIEEIKNCLELGEDRKTVIGRETEYPSPETGSIVTDSVFDVRIPGSDDMVSVIVNVEAQRNPNPGYPLGKRAEYYVARMVSSQKGREFTGTDYGKIRNVYSIWCVLRPNAKDRNTAVRYSMSPFNLSGDPDREMEALETFNIIMVNIGPYDESLPNISAFTSALFSEMGNTERRKVMGERFNISLDDDIMRRLNGMTTLDEEAYEDGFRNGRAEGMAEGKAEAIEMVVDLILVIIKDTNGTIEDILSRFPIREDLRPEVEAKVRERLQ